MQIFRHDRHWLAPLGLLLVAGAALLRPALDRRARANGLVLVGAAGFAYAFAQGFAIGPGGWSHPALAAMFGALRGGQYGMGLGAFLVVTAFAMLLALGLAGRGYFKGDAFVAGSVVAVGALVAVFTFFPVARILLQALENNDGAFSLAGIRRATDDRKDLGHRVHRRRDALRRRLEHAAARAALRVRLHGARARLRVDRHAHALPVQEAAARPVGAADHHAALRDRPRAHPAVRPLRTRQPVPRMGVRHRADALDLRHAGHSRRADLRVHADRLPRADRRGRGRVAGAGGGGADAARRPLAHVSSTCRCR